MTGNQKLDLIIATSDTHGTGSSLPDIISVVNENGDGSFATFPLYGGIPELNVVQPSIILGTLAAADFNGDGKIDLDVGIQYLAQVVPVQMGEGLYLNAGSGSFSAPMTFTAKTFPFVIAADFRGNGRTDLASADSGSNGLIAILLGNGDGTFQPEVDYGSGMYGPIAAGDFNNDGELDVIGLSASSGQDLSVLRGNGDGTFGFPIQTNTGSTAPLSVLAVADFNHDGKLDVAISVGGSTSLSPKEIQVFLGNGDGTFSVSQTYSAGSNPTAIAVGDVNGDGIPDIVVGNSDYQGTAASSVVVLLGNGDGTFKSPITTVVGNGIIALSVADFNLDGKADIAISNTGWSDVSVLLGNGDGTFQAPMQFYLANSYLQGGLAVADFDGDGKPDIAVTGVENISVLLSKGLSGPATLLGPSTLSLGSNLVGGTNTPTQQAVLSNSGSATVSIGGITISGAQIGDYKQTNTCGATLAPGANCTITVIFVPQAGGTRTATLQVTDSAPNSPQMISLSGMGQDFSVIASSPSQAVSPGQTATYNVSVSPESGFNQTVTMTCTGAPSLSSCSVSPKSFTLNGTGAQAVTVTVTVTTTGPSSSVTLPWIVPPTGGIYGWATWSFASLGMIALLTLLSRRRGGSRRWFYGLTTLCLLCIGTTLLGCGGSSSGGGGGGGIQPGNYNLTVTGQFTSGSLMLTHSSQLTLVVQ